MSMLISLTRISLLLCVLVFAGPLACAKKSSKYRREPVPTTSSVPFALQVTGGLSAAEITQVMDAKAAEIRYCSSNTLAKYEGDFGKLLVAFTVDSNGHANNVRALMSTIENVAIEGCLLNRIRLWTFPSAREQPAEVVYPFEFTHAN